MRLSARPRSVPPGSVPPGTVRRRPALTLALMVPLLMASKCRKDKDVLDEDDGTGLDDANSPEVRLQVISMDPDHVGVSTPFQANLYGSGIEPGATVDIGGTSIPGVDYRTDNELRLSVPPLDAGTYDVTVQNPDGATATLRGGLWVDPEYRDVDADFAQCGNLTVRFALDSSAIEGAHRELLDAQADCLARLGAAIRVEGHCDERGTTDYNLALGQRRAEAVQKYLVARGVPPSRLRTVSYGEERPLDRGHDEAAWATNRRAEIVAER